ncbi:MAG: glycine cleavage system aminomethyltransferase GcvT, partial [Betaproteobacteria bacterium]|nr:glycine cleavage system aminomethyltransferase GcvT [Betaproteobacteria bacterium]
MTDLLETPLAAAHEALGAKMVPFSGWRMPLQYTSILSEHQHTRSAAGLFDLSHMGRLAVQGPDALHLIQRAATNDASRLAPGAAHYSLVCNEQGGIIDDVLVYRLPDRWRLVVNADNRDRVVRHLTELRDRLGFETELRDDTLATGIIGIQGPESLGALQPHVEGDLDALGYYRFLETRLGPEPGGAAVSVSRTGYTGEDGFEITVDAVDATALWQRLMTDERVRPVGLGARDTLRLEAGMPLYGHEIADDVNPYEAGLGRAVKLDKGWFVGCEALSRLADETPRRRLVGLALGSGAVPRQGCAVLLADREVGAVASGTFSPSLKHPIATAFVSPEATSPGTELRVVIRDSQVPARVVSLPFVPHR